MKQNRRSILVLYLALAVVLGAGIQVYVSAAGTGMPLLDGKADQLTTGRYSPLLLGGTTGVTLYGGAEGGVSTHGSGISGVSNTARDPEAGIPVHLEPPEGGENFWCYNRDDTGENGTTIYVIPTSGVTVISNVPCTGGVSKYVLAGAALEKKLIAWSDSPGTYIIDAVGEPDVEAQ